MSEPLTANKQDDSVPARHELANAIRALAMDAVQKANSGHPGAPMGMANFIEVLWRDFLSHNPNNPHWFNRDRFVLSNGHGSMLLYAVLHLSGYALSIDDIKNFRQLGSKTPGHPEFGDTPGVETTTGPLGQGLANAVGMALAEKNLAANFNRPGFNIVDHHTYVCMGDGCLMEGISHEACSLAGTLKLGKLIALYDDNQISIDGNVAGWFTDDTPGRFTAYGWQVIANVDGHDPSAVHAALIKAREETERPSLICCKTTIGFGAPNKAGTAGSHGAPLGEEEITGTREALGWSHAPFDIPETIYAAWDARNAGSEREAEWQQLFIRYRDTHGALASELERRIAGALPTAWQQEIEGLLTALIDDTRKIATRKASGNFIETIAPLLPELIGGSADLSGSNLTNWSGTRAITGDDASGNYINYGVREFAMTALMSGLALHGGFIPYAGTFLVFSDYARNALRLAALMGVQNISIYTHDSIGLGEDGPTHQPIEHAASLRLIPNLSLWRPCDGIETAAAWRYAIERKNGPTCLLLSRQGIEPPKREAGHLALVERGGYILLEPSGDPEALIIATGSEVPLALAAAETLNGNGHHIRVVSMPSCDVYDAQDQTYRDAVLPPSIRKRLAVEAGSPDYWRKYVGLDGDVIGLSSFGASAPGDAVYAHFNLTSETVTQRLSDLLQRH